MSAKIKTPILNKAVKERAAKKLRQGNASKGFYSQKPAVTGSIVQPIQVSKNDPIVRKMLGLV
ncbi:hypothetical protein CVD28_14145 [Bacillus sp. M6-12]|uniref:hypothetical protein n=1 Tax=Bacillus sp. M6-12 TaxID=2054166 RepID=UPI000C760C18|nr:hypothetical protein [Bacillus sp. M6-12]PLS17188.1 hypothetical protein CVD28_14145 [Bacillus sp. M6-12]